MEEIIIIVEDLTEEVTLISKGEFVEAPIDGKIYGRKNADWEEVAGGSGSGDMTKSVYDPTDVDGDVFDYNNFTNTPTTITTQQSADITTNNAKTGVTNEQQNTINSEVEAGMTGEDLVLNVLSLTQSEYDAGTPVATTFYIITDA